MKIVEPKWRAHTFTCPHCGTLASMRWNVVESPFNRSSAHPFKDHVFAAFCTACYRPNIWTDEKMVYPSTSGVEPHPDMPDKAKALFNEAQAVVGNSPRASCALLRLCLEVIVDHLNGKGKNLYERIDSLNLPPDLREVFTACRIVGNQAAHPGEINFESSEGKELAATLSGFTNLIVAFLISPIIQAREILKKAKHS